MRRSSESDDRFRFLERERERDRILERERERSEDAGTESSEAQARWDFAAAAWDGLESSSEEMGKFSLTLSFQLFYSWRILHFVRVFLCCVFDVVNCELVVSFFFFFRGQ